MRITRPLASGVLAVAVLAVAVWGLSLQPRLVKPAAARGSEISLEEAKRLAPYPILAPRAIPGSPAFDHVVAWGAGKSFTVGLFYEDRTVIEFLPNSRFPTDYTKAPGRKVRVRGVFALVDDAETKPHRGMGFTGSSIHWREGPYTIVVGGHRPVLELVEIAETLEPV